MGNIQRRAGSKMPNRAPVPPVPASAWPFSDQLMVMVDKYVKFEKRMFSPLDAMLDVPTNGFTRIVLGFTPLLQLVLLARIFLFPYLGLTAPWRMEMALAVTNLLCFALQFVYFAAAVDNVQEYMHERWGTAKPTGPRASRHLSEFFSAIAVVSFILGTPVLCIAGFKGFAWCLVVLHVLLYVNLLVQHSYAAATACRDRYRAEARRQQSRADDLERKVKNLELRLWSANRDRIHYRHEIETLRKSLQEQHTVWFRENERLRIDNLCQPTITERRQELERLLKEQEDRHHAIQRRLAHDLGNEMNRIWHQLGNEVSKAKNNAHYLRRELQFAQLAIAELERERDELVLRNEEVEERLRASGLEGESDVESDVEEDIVWVAPEAESEEDGEEWVEVEDSPEEA